MRPTPTQRRGGFTLIELLVVIAIIGILSTLAIVALGSARQKSRDAKRLADLKQVANALELYYSDNNQYPTAITPGQPLSSGTTAYMASVPNNPFPRADGSCPDQNYVYSVDRTNTNYSFTGCVGTSSLSSPSTNSSAVSASASGTFICGQNVTDSEGNSYGTVQVGTQCWMKENMRIGTRVDSKMSWPCIAVSGGYSCQLDNGVIEKYCHSESPANCLSSGGLYEWNEAMQYSTSEGAQGICPSGWHIPSNAEQHVLELYLTDSPANETTCNGSRNGTYSCTGAPVRLKTGGSSGFNWLLAGYRLNNTALYGDSSTVGYIWTSTESGHSNAWYREVASAPDLLLRALNKYRGHSVRCLKN